jgi:hypothetical protein
MSHTPSTQLTFDMSCLYSTVRNNSGQARTYGFLPPHGRKLAVDEEFTLFGHVTEAMIAFERVTSKRSIDALQRSLDSGDLLIISTPNPIMQDVTTAEVKMIQLDGGSLTLVDPCWKVSSS